jgi:hypothetical protein
MPRGANSTDPRDRRIIIVASPAELRRCASRAAASAVEVSVSPLLPVAGEIVFRVGMSAIANLSMRKLTEEELLQRLEDELRLGIPIALYDQSEATRLFKFDVGHMPKDGSLYVQHPILPNYYIPPEDFARTLAKEKEAAFRQLASALGAKELRLVSADVHSKKGWFGTKVSVPEVASQLGVRIEFDSNGSFVRRVYSRFGRPRQPPHVPKDLRAWVEMDPDLRTMARDRTKGHLLQHHITLEFKECMGAGGDVAAAVAGRGLTAGGAYEALYHSVWHFEAEYWPLDADDEEPASADES